MPKVTRASRTRRERKGLNSKVDAGHAYLELQIGASEARLHASHVVLAADLAARNLELESQVVLLLKVSTMTQDRVQKLSEQLLAATRLIVRVVNQVGREEDGGLNEHEALAVRRDTRNEHHSPHILARE
jgi:hypothetical protein